MFAKRAFLAACTLALLAAASWLPARAGPPPAAAEPDLARPTLLPPSRQAAAAHSPVAAASAFFWAIAAAASAAPAAPAPSQTASGASGGTPPAGTQWARAYALLTPGWQAGLPFATFVSSWAGLRRLDLLAALAAGSPPGDPRAGRVLVEIRTLTTRAGDAAPCLCYAWGLYTAVPSKAGYLLQAGRLQPEAFGAGRQDTPAAAAVAAARAAATAGSLPGAGGPAQVAVRPGADHQSTATVTLGPSTLTVRLYQLVDGQPIAYAVQR